MKSDSDAKRYRCPKCGTGIDAADLDAIFEEELAHFLETRWEAFADILVGNGDQPAGREHLRDLFLRRTEREEERGRIEDLYLKKHLGHERFGALDERAKQDILEIEVAMREVESSETTTGAPSSRPSSIRWSSAIRTSPSPHAKRSEAEE